MGRIQDKKYTKPKIEQQAKKLNIIVVYTPKELRSRNYMFYKGELPISPRLNAREAWIFMTGYGMAVAALGLKHA